MKINNKTHILYLLDSYLLLPQSLEKLGKTFNVSTLKDIFPYTFVNKFNFNYIKYIFKKIQHKKNWIIVILK